MPTIIELEKRVMALEQFIVRNSLLWNETDVAQMLAEDSLRGTINDTAESDFCVTADMKTLAHSDFR